MQIELIEIFAREFLKLLKKLERCEYEKRQFLAAFKYLNNLIKSVDDKLDKQQPDDK